MNKITTTIIYNIVFIIHTRKQIIQNNLNNVNFNPSEYNTYILL